VRQCRCAGGAKHGKQSVPFQNLSNPRRRQTGTGGGSFSFVTALMKFHKIQSNTIRLSGDGRLSGSPDTFPKQLAHLRGLKPEELVDDDTSRDELERLLQICGGRMDADARCICQNALAVSAAALPVKKPTDFELLAYAGELEAGDPVPGTGVSLTKGRMYPAMSGVYRFEEPFIRRKPVYNEYDDSFYMEDHRCTRSGIDRYISIKDDDGHAVRFTCRPQGPNDKPEELVWLLFNKPKVPTVKEGLRGEFDRHMEMLDVHEVLSDFNYYPGQREYIARHACKNFGLIQAETGVGKTLVGISLMILKGASRCLVVAPKGTVKRAHGVSQWEEEIGRFAPGVPVHKLFSKDDWHRLAGPSGKGLPEGVFLSYPEALSVNGARETLPPSWDESDVIRRYRIPRGARHVYSEGVGVSNNGICCILEPSLATLAADAFDMIVVDEAHLMQNPKSLRTSAILRMQARCRYALTATPIPNMLTDVFPLLGWLTVPGWYRGNCWNKIFPYSLGELSRFQRAYLSKERDHTEEAQQAAMGRKGRRSFYAPGIANPIGLLKLLKPVASYVEKKHCRPDLPPCGVTDVRVPFGTSQATLYRRFLSLAHTRQHLRKPKANVLVQQTLLRNVCCDPAGMGAASNFNPKTVAVLEITADKIGTGEQCVLVSSRLGQLNEFERRLREAGVGSLRIDSSLPSDGHAETAARFKRGDAPVLLMGIKMAQAFSFSNCSNLIITSLEWDFKSKQQAMGRVWRLDSPRPVNVFCVLNENSIEEVMYDRVAIKADAAFLCLKGERVRNPSHVVDAVGIGVEHIINYDASGGTVDEIECEKQWPALRDKLSLSA